MIKKISIIGDSFIGYMSGGRLHKGMPKALEYGSFLRNKNGYDLLFLWQHSRTAHKVDFDYLENLFKDYAHMLDSETIIVPQFGGMDIMLGHFKKHKNMEDVVKKYSESVIKFTKKYGTGLIFMPSWWQPDNKEDYLYFDDMFDLLREISLENGLPEPIKIMDNVVQKDYPVLDIYKHHTPEDSERIVDYIISRIEEVNNA